MNPWISFAIGLLMLAPFTVQVTRFVRSRLRYRRWTRTDARVIGMDESRSSSHETGAHRSYVARYVFLDHGSRSRMGRAEVPRRLPLDSDLAVVYDPADPKRSEPVSRFGAAHIAAGAMGFLVFLFGVFATVNGILLLTTGTGIE